MSWINRKTELLQIARIYEPKVKNFHTMDHWFPRFLGWIVALLGLMSSADWRVNTALSVCGHLFFPVHRSFEQVAKDIPHEARHVTQQKWLGLGSPWLGFIPWLILYGLIPLPIGCAFFRCFFEIDAQQQYWKMLIYKGLRHEAEEDAIYLARNLSSWIYFLAMPEWITIPWAKYVASKTEGL
jgi:hypothetical protein